MRLLIFFLAFVFLSLTAQAEEKRIALLIGNNDYPASVGRLANTHNDVGKLKASLQSVGFEVITELDRDEDGMMRAVSSFTSRVDSEAGKGNKVIAFFYYAGHGVSVNKEGMQKNYLLPARETISSRFDLFSKGIDLGDVISAFSATKASAFFVVSDACRNELGVTFSRSVGSRGFNVMPQRPGMLIAYSTAAGATAPDDGKFASILADKIKTPGVRAEVSFIDALADISVERGLNDRPFMSAGRLPRDFCFAGCKMGHEDRDWLYTKEIDVISGYEFFLRRYPSGKFATDAHAAIARLKNSDTDFIPNPEPSPKPTPSPSPTPTPAPIDGASAWTSISGEDWNVESQGNLVRQVLKSTDLETLQRASSAGDPKAMRLMAAVHLGLGVISGPVDHNKTVLLYSKACSKGELNSCYHLGSLYINGTSVISRDFQKAFTLNLNACNASFFRACDNMSILFRKGLGVPKDYAKSFAYSVKACNGNSYTGCNNIGFHYEFGLGRPKDFTKAISYYTSACSKNHATACHNAATMYADGKGVKKSKAKARKYFKLACDLGRTVSCHYRP